MMVHVRRSLAAVVCLGVATPAAARPPAPAHKPLIRAPVTADANLARALQEHYTKHEARIPMRDGVQLHTHIYVPKDHTRTWPILVLRTPYSIRPYGVDRYPTASDPRALRNLAPSHLLIAQGYILVQQDVRGRMMSEGTFVDVRPVLDKTRGPRDIDETTDAWDTIDWLVKHVPGNNGRVGLWGISYPGFYAAQSAVGAHPALRAVSPQAPVTEWFLGDDFHHNGAFFLADAFGFYASFGRPRDRPTTKMTWGFEYGAGDLYEFFLRMGPLPNADTRYLKGGIPFWNDLMAHGTYDGFWKARDPRPHYRAARPAILTVGGWFDAEDLFGALETYRAFEAQSPGADNRIVMGPWGHGGWARTAGSALGPVSFGAPTSRFYQEQIELPFFEHHLRGAPLPSATEAWMFETGTNQWRAYPVWPPREARPGTLWLQPEFGLAAHAPTDADGADAYTSDPEHPVPYLPDHTLDVDATYMVADQRFAARRPDVLSYRSAPLTEDVVLAGPIEADLWFSTTGTDADVVVKLIDVHPPVPPGAIPDAKHPATGGMQQLVRAEVMRGKFRNSLSTPEAFQPGTPTRVRFTLPDINHAFRPGHRLMVQIQSTWFPLVDRNPQTFTDIYHARASEFRTATHRVHRSAAHASQLRVRVLRGALPGGTPSR